MKNMPVWHLVACVFFISACSDYKSGVSVDLNQTATVSDSGKNKRTKGTYTFGFDLRGSPQEDARQYLPLMKYLEQETGYKFELKFTPKNQSTAQLLGEDEIDFAAVGATSYIKAKQKYNNVVSLVRGLNPKAKSKYRSMLVVAPKSKIKTIADIRGQRLAFGNIDSTQGHLIPRIMLQEHGITLSDLKSYFYTGSHRNCAQAVVSNKADVCGMQDTLAMEMSERNLLRIMHESAYFPSSGIVANTSVNETVRNKVTQALLNFDPQGKHKQDLYHWHLTEMPLGFEIANEQDYEALRQWMIKLEFID